MRENLVGGRVQPSPNVLDLALVRWVGLSLESPEYPVSMSGDLWLLGRHRILCGDSTVAIDVERALGGVEPHLMVTDPPYGVIYDPA
jgi:hypothetical protein